jgi:hypothetical protein
MVIRRMSYSWRGGEGVVEYVEVQALVTHKVAAP